MRSVAFLVAGLLTVVTAGTVFAQGMNFLGPEKKDPQADQRREEIERQYRAATQNIPDQKGVNDPWNNMRSVPDAKPAAKPKTSAR